MKRCTRCGEYGEFYRCSSTKDGWQSACKKCKREQVEHWEKCNPGRKRAMAEADYQRNREAKLDYQRNFRKENPEKVRVHYRKAAHIRRAREANAFIEDVDPRVVYEMHGGMCGICKEFVSFADFEIDHVIPIARGGKHGYVNVQPAHRFCNRSKRDRLEGENLIVDLVSD